jgi:hypothetical protein
MKKLHETIDKLKFNAIMSIDNKINGVKSIKMFKFIGLAVKGASR